MIFLGMLLGAIATLILLLVVHKIQTVLTKKPRIQGLWWDITSVLMNGYPAINSLLSQLDDVSADIVLDFWRESVENFTLFIRKQLDYGPGNIAKSGEHGVVIRTDDKLERLKNLLFKHQEAKNESREDSWRDVANYGTIGLLCFQGKWPEYTTAKRSLIGNDDIDLSDVPASP